MRRTPRRFRCQPELALERRRDALGVATLSAPDAEAVTLEHAPVFASERFGDPGYLQLPMSTSRAVLGGAESGGEMGAFESLRQLQRQSNLQACLEENLPIGLSPALVYVT